MARFSLIFGGTGASRVADPIRKVRRVAGRLETAWSLVGFRLSSHDPITLSVDLMKTSSMRMRSGPTRDGDASAESRNYSGWRVRRLCLARRPCRKL